MTKDICQLYTGLNFPSRREFLEILANDFGIKSDKVAEAAKSFLLNPTKPKSIETISEAISPIYSIFFKQVLMNSDGLNFILRLRADLIVKFYA